MLSHAGDLDVHGATGAFDGGQQAGLAHDAGHLGSTGGFHLCGLLLGERKKTMGYWHSATTPPEPADEVNSTHPRWRVF